MNKHIKSISLIVIVLFYSSLIPSSDKDYGKLPTIPSLTKTVEGSGSYISQIVGTVITAVLVELSIHYTIKFISNYTKHEKTPRSGALQNNGNSTQFYQKKNPYHLIKSAYKTSQKNFPGKGQKLEEKETSWSYSFLNFWGYFQSKPQAAKDKEDRIKNSWEKKHPDQIVISSKEITPSMVENKKLGDVRTNKLSRRPYLINQEEITKQYNEIKKKPVNEYVSLSKKNLD